LTKDKWTGRGSSTYEGTQWDSPATLEFKENSLRYEDVTNGKPWVGVYTRTAKAKK
jgi:hypothetical protein